MNARLTPVNRIYWLQREFLLRKRKVIGNRKNQRTPFIWIICPTAQIQVDG